MATLELDLRNEKENNQRLAFELEELKDEMAKYRNMKEMILTSLDLDVPEGFQSRSQLDVSPIQNSYHTTASPIQNSYHSTASPVQNSYHSTASPMQNSYQSTQSIPRVPLLDFNDLTSS